MYVASIHMKSDDDSTGCLESVEWNGGMEYWNGMVEWNGGME